jgi:ribosome-associated protein YbcJ (S4-like RNA binding protein)
VKVNEEIEYQRGKKLYAGDIVEFKENQIRIIK